MKAKLLLLSVLMVLNTNADTEKLIVSKWKSCLLPTENLSFTTEAIKTVDRGVDISSDPVRIKEKVKINLLSNEQYHSRLYFFEEGGLRHYTTSWDGKTCIQNDRVQFGAQALSYDLITDPGSVNIYNKNQGGVLHDISRLWLDAKLPYLNTIIKYEDLFVYNAAEKKIAVGDILFILSLIHI